MRQHALRHPTVRHALLAAVVALAVTAPATVLLSRLIDRAAVQPATAAAPAATPFRLSTAGVATGPFVGPRRPGATRRPALPGPGLPGSVRTALAASRIVVVALYVAGDTIDMAASAEAEAGAELGKVPYVAINVNDESQIGDLASRLTSLTVPSTVLLGPGGTVLQQLEGWSDRDTVASAIDSRR